MAFVKRTMQSVKCSRCPTYMHSLFSSSVGTAPVMFNMGWNLVPSICMGQSIFQSSNDYHWSGRNRKILAGMKNSWQKCHYSLSTIKADIINWSLLFSSAFGHSSRIFSSRELPTDQIQHAPNPGVSFKILEFKLGTEVRVHDPSILGGLWRMIRSLSPAQAI